MSETALHWTSIHVHLEGSATPVADLYGPVCDSVLTGLVAPLAVRLRRDGRVARMFFVRYGWAGPHVRLRFLAPHRDQGSLFDVVVQACRNFDFPIRPEAHTLDPRRAAYEPEFDRYCGTTGVALAERLFDASSTLALELLPLIAAEGKSDSELRLGLGVVSIVLLVRALLGDDEPANIAWFLSQYSAGGLGRLDADRREEATRWVDETAAHQDRLYTALAPVLEGGPHALLPEPFAGAVSNFAEVRTGLIAAWRDRPLWIYGALTRDPRDALRRLTSSYLHMHLNRLGIAPWNESVVCAIAARAIEEGAPCPT